MTSSPIAVIGAGPAGLMAAEQIASAGWPVTVFERMPSPARKFLMAGRGGLNLTHSEPLDRFLTRYGEAGPHLAPFIAAFPPDALRHWAAELGEETFIGSSGRVFPRSFKASPLLRAWLRRLAGQGVELRTRHTFLGWDADGALRVSTSDGEMRIAAPACVLAFGGASWPRLGSDGAWAQMLRAGGLSVSELRSANAGVRVSWTEPFRARFAGTPLKRIALTAGGRTVRGEAMVTAGGLEGGAVYALGPEIRSSREPLLLDLRPDMSAEALTARLEAAPRRLSLSEMLRKTVGLPPVSIGLLREGAEGPVAVPRAPAALAARIKALPLPHGGLATLERAISTAGGLAWDEVDGALMLRPRPGVFACGEMLDWEAPTGGYLLQACFSTGLAAGQGVLSYLRRREAE